MSLRILVSGASGYISSSLVPKLFERGHTLGLISRSIIETNNQMKSRVTGYQIKPSPSFESIQEIVQDFKPDVILHLAASWKVGSEEDFLNQCISTNIDFASTLAKSALLNGVGFINIASYWELQLHEFELRVDHYTNSKRTFANILSQMKMRYGFQYTTIYLFDNYGPNDTRGKLLSSLGQSIREGTQLTLTRWPHLTILQNIDPLTNQSVWVSIWGA